MAYFRKPSPSPERNRRSQDISLQLLNSNSSDSPYDERRNSGQQSSPFLTAPSPYTRQGSFRGVTPPLPEPSTTLSYPGYSTDIRPSLEFDAMSRTSNLRGVDAVYQSGISGSTSDLLLSMEESNAIQLGLEDALGKRGKWLTKNNDAKADPLPDINTDQLSMNFDRPLSQISLAPTDSRYTNEEIRSVEEGLLHVNQTKRDSLMPPKSPVVQFSRAVKALSNRILTGQEIPDVPSRENTVSPSKQQDSSNIASSSISLNYEPKSPKSPRYEYIPSKYPEYHDDPLSAISSRQSPSPSSDPYFARDSFQSSHNDLSDNPILDDSSPPPEPLPIKLVGSSLKIFGPDNKFRLFLYHALHQVWVEPLIFFLIIFQTVILTIGNAQSIFEGSDASSDDYIFSVFPVWYKWFVNWCQLGVYICYTIIVVAKIIAYGLWDDSQRAKLIEMAKRAQEEPDSDLSTPTIPHGIRRRNAGKNIPVVHTFANLFPNHNRKSYILQPAESIHVTSGFQVVSERAYLRSSWARVDFIAIVSYWVSFSMMVGQADIKNEVFIFRLLSALPILHLLNMTVGTSSILKSLKVASPLLVNVGLFLGFFWVLFAIIGVQSFSYSLRRYCVWTNPTNSSDTYTSSQHCGSFMMDGVRMPYLNYYDQYFTRAKGYTCPQNSQCLTQDNPYGGTISFDNILTSIEMVFVIMSFNTFTDIMYDIVDSESLLSSLFFIVGSLALGLWLANLFIAVIVTSFKATREENGNVDRGDAAMRVAALFAGNSVHIKHICRKRIGQIYHYFREIPLLIILTDLFIQCSINYTSSERQLENAHHFQFFVTNILAFEIVLRFIIYLPKVRLFFSSPMNCIDLALVCLTSILLIPDIVNNHILYGWLSIFQIARFYRVVLSIGFVRNLWARVLSDFRPILNITLFYYLITFLAAILACQLLRGVVPLESSGSTNFFTFHTLANSFVAMYTISTTENWTAILYLAVESADSKFSQACIAAFFIGWFILSNYVVLNMFVAIITENLDISPAGKRREQIKAFVLDIINERTQNNNNLLQETGNLLLQKLKLRKRGPAAYTEQPALQLIQQDKMDTFLVEEPEHREREQENDLLEEKNSRSLLKTIKNLPFRSINSFLERKRREQLENPFHDSNEVREFEREHHTTSDALVFGLLRAKTELESQRKEYLEEHPDYNKSLKMFRPEHPIRKFCQKIVAPSYGSRLEGYNPRPIVWYLFSTFMLLSTLVLVIIAVIVTPIYYKRLTEEHLFALNWVIVTDIILVIIFTLECFIKVIADGFYFTPNAYLRSVWGIIDFIVLVAMWMNMIQEMTNRNKAARLIRAFKALRALRLLSFSPKAQELFHNMILAGIWKLFAAAIVALGLLFPFSVWGQNIFSGRLFSCNDGSFSGNLTACVGEYENSPFNWNVLSPKTVVSSYYDFNEFGHSILVLFEIISLEGWVDVLQSAMNISPGFSQPEYYAGKFNGIFFMLYNLIGTIFILTLFISVIIQNYSVLRGSAYMTGDQKTWYEIQKTLRMVRPSMRPSGLVPGTFRSKLFELVVRPNSWLNIATTVNLGIIAVILIVEFYPRSNYTDYLSKTFLLVFMVFFFVTVIVRLYALGFRKFFRRRWDIYALLMTMAALAMVSLSLSWLSPNLMVFLNFQKLFSVGMLILLMPRSRRLDQLLKTCASSASVIGNLLLVWAILFLTYSIAFNQVFGLTRIGPNGSSAINFRTVPNAMVLLYRMSCGEGWNQILHDFLVEFPACYVDSSGYTDCGSKAYAYTLFISWNVISMYIFANMFVSLIYENFSYVSRKPDSKINRDEIRKFKIAWFKLDPNSTGYIPKSKLYELLGSLEEGSYFSLKINKEPWTVRSILGNSMAETDSKYNVDLRALNKEMRLYPAQQSMERRHQFEKFCQHAFLLADPVRGINFNQLLIQFPFYKDMTYSECLKLHDYIRYRDIERRVMERISQERTASAILMAQAVARHKARMRNRNRHSFDNTSVHGGSWMNDDPFSDPVVGSHGSRNSSQYLVALNSIVPAISVHHVDDRDDFRT